MSTVLGAIADDFTGATDLANTLVKKGMRTTQVIGVPDDVTPVDDARAVVVALKSRTAPIDEAVSSSLASLEWLNTRGAKQIFFKYCSTFDSTSKGNIGPVSDALMKALACDFAFVCPAFPENGRTIYRGHLFVGDELLSESSMKDHPLTPMRDANLVRLMGAQSRRRVGLIPLQDVRRGAAAIEARVDGLRSEGVSYGVVDAVTDDDLHAIGHAAADHLLVTGGSGVALGLPGNFRTRGALGDPEAPTPPSVTGRQVVLAGSCSAATRAQIDHVRGSWPSRKIDVDAVAARDGVAGELIEWACSQGAAAPVLIYTSSSPDEVAAIQRRYGVEHASAMVEGVMGELAQGLFANGFSRIVVAGGETSGAVVSALQVKALRIGPEVDPGVPWTESLGDAPIALALKSGNFGGDDFFAKAFEMLG